MRPVISRFLLVLALLAAPMARAQAPAEAGTRPLRLREFLDEIQRTNLDLAAERFSLPIADAQITLARLFPDPQLTGGLDAYDLTEQRLPTSVIYGLAQTLELGGKRQARITEARAGRTLAEAQLEDFFQTLRVNAANAFVDALAARRILARKKLTLESVETLVAATAERLRVGDVSPSALWQVRVESERFRSEMIRAEGDVRAADHALEAFLGPPKPGEPPRLAPAGELELAPRSYDAATLIAHAVASRSDVLVAAGEEDAARAHVGVAKANRWVDVSLAASITQAPAAPAMNAPAIRTLGLTATLPIPFSRLTHGELDAARAGAGQAEAQVLSAKRRVDVEVRQALARYEATRDAAAVYAGPVLENAQRALEAMRFSYERGAARLIELLDAQRTADDVFIAYAGALADQAKALVALQRASALWDVDF